MELPGVLHQTLKRLKLTQTVLGVEMGVTPSYISHVVKGRTVLTPQRAIQLAEVLRRFAATPQELQAFCTAFVMDRVRLEEQTSKGGELTETHALALLLRVATSGVIA